MDCDVISRVTFRIHCIILFYGVILSTNSSNQSIFSTNTSNQSIFSTMSSVIICTVCLETIFELSNTCDRGHILCDGCTSVFEGCPACNNFNLKTSSKATDIKQVPIDVIDSDDEVDKKLPAALPSVGTKRKAPLIVLDSDTEDDEVHCVKCNDILEEDDDSTCFECRHYACGACLQLLDECPKCDQPKPKQAKCECVVCIAENVICDAEPQGFSCITCSSLGVNCVFEN